MTQYFTGTTTLPSDGSAVPVCYVGPAGAMIYDPTSTGTTVYVGGPDVTTDIGMPIPSGTATLIPGLVTQQAPPVVPAPPPDPVPVLYACCTSGKTSTVSWLSRYPAPA